MPDSACTANAIFGGVKGNYGVVGLSGYVSLHNCTAQQDESTHIEPIFKFAQDEGKISL